MDIRKFFKESAAVLTGAAVTLIVMWGFVRAAGLGDFEPEYSAPASAAAQDSAAREAEIELLKTYEQEDFNFMTGVVLEPEDVGEAE